MASIQVRGPVNPEQAEAWREVCVSRGIADSVWLPEEQKSFAGVVRWRQLGDLTLVDMEAEPFGVRYRPGSPAYDYVGFGVNHLESTERFVFDDRTEHIQTASVGVWDPARLVESEVLSPIAQTMVLIPKSALRLRSALPLSMGEMVALQDCSALRLLRDLLLAVAAEAERMAPAEVTAARNSIVELMLVATRFRSTTSTGIESEAMRRAIGTWIDERLHLGQLSPTEAAEHHAISVRSLHRLFAGTGETFGSLVRQRRLDRAWHDLVATDDKIQSIAVRWGYSDASHFISDFKRVHGMTPVSYRQASQAPA